MRNWLNCKTRTEKYLTLKVCTGYLGHPFLHQEHRECMRSREEDSLVGRAAFRACSLCVCETQPASLRAREEEKDMPKTRSGLGHDRGTDGCRVLCHQFFPSSLSRLGNCIKRYRIFMQGIEHLIETILL